MLDTKFIQPNKDSRSKCQKAEPDEYDELMERFNRLSEKEQQEVLASLERLSFFLESDFFVEDSKFFGLIYLKSNPSISYQVFNDSWFKYHDKGSALLQSSSLAEVFELANNKEKEFLFFNLDLFEVQ